MAENWYYSQSFEVLETNSHSLLISFKDLCNTAYFLKNTKYIIREFGFFSDHAHDLLCFMLVHRVRNWKSWIPFQGHAKCLKVISFFRSFVAQIMIYCLAKAFGTVWGSLKNAWKGILQFTLYHISSVEFSSSLSPEHSLLYFAHGSLISHLRTVVVNENKTLHEEVHGTSEPRVSCIDITIFQFWKKNTPQKLFKETKKSQLQNFLGSGAPRIPEASFSEMLQVSIWNSWNFLKMVSHANICLVQVLTLWIKSSACKLFNSCLKTRDANFLYLSMTVKSLSDFPLHPCGTTIFWQYFWIASGK